MIEAHTDPSLPPPAGPYSQVVQAHGLVWTAGFGPQDPVTGAVPRGITAQTEQALDNVERALELVGLSLRDCVKVTVHLEHLKRDFEAFNAVYARRFTAPYPVRTTVGSDLMDILVEVDATAVYPSGAGR